MPSRSRRTDHCDNCRLFRPLCVCGAAAELRSQLAALQGWRTSVVILMHVREVTLPTNTARLAEAALPACELRLRGALNQPMSTDGLVEAGRRSFLLYPSEEASELTPALVSTGSVKLIVPDGSWRQARKVASREPALRDIPHVKLPPGPPSRYRLRKEPNERSVSTYEAIARALGVLEGEDVQRRLEDLFDMRVERTLWARGMLKAEQTRFGIPQEAFDTFHRHGCAGGEKAKRLLEEARASASAEE